MANVQIVEVWLQQQLVGKIALAPEGLCAFEYDAEYIAHGVSISPFLLPLRSGLFIAKRDPFNGGFGVFDDSLPDGWGNLILDRYLLSKGINPHKLLLTERLSLVGSTGRGALEYRPDKSVASQIESVDFDQLAAETHRMLTTEYSGVSLETLYRQGGSPGGARPKIFVNIENREWLVKFRAATDPESIGVTEFDYAVLARECGIEMPETRLFEGKYFGVERFDRTNNGKIHTISAAGLLNADYRIPSLDYSTLLLACQKLTLDMEQVYALFRRMVFNAVISNRDDHAKNFAFQLREGKWTLSPAYDLLPSNGFNGYHTTTFDGNGEPTRSNILSVAIRAGLNKTRAVSIIDEIIERCAAKNCKNVDLM